MSCRWLLIAVLLITSLAILTEAQRKGRKVAVRKKGRKNGNKGSKSGTSTGKKMKQDACTAAGHPCMAGYECIVERYTGQERCVCVEHCPYYPNAEVCGSDMKTYTTGCHLYKHACDNHRMIFPISFGSCDKMHTSHLKVVPKMAKACENSHTSFRCQYDDMVEGISEWRKGKEELKSGAKYEIRDNMLTVKNIILSDEGNYTCITIDTNGTMREANATLKLTQAPFANIPSNHISCEHGDRVMIPCLHSDDTEVQWMKNGFEVEEGNGIHVDSAGMLILPQTEFEAAGTYKCVATNFCGSASSQCEVTVKERDPDRCEDDVPLVDGCEDFCRGMVCEAIPELECQVTRCGECGYYWTDEKMRNTTCPQLEAPKILNSQSVSLTSEGEDAVIQCVVEGYPTPSITWTHENGTKIEELRKHSLRGYDTLVIRQLVLGVDNGRYKCIAENSEGRAEFTTVVAILPRMTPMCPRDTDKVMSCETDFCATATCPAVEGTNEKLTCINTVCNVCTYIFVDKKNQYVDCYSDPKLVKKMKQMSNMGGMSSNGAWPASSSMGGMNMPGWPASGSMGGMNMPGWPASGSMGGMNMPGWPASGSMSGMNMPGWPASGSMGGMNMPGWPASSSMSGNSMGGGSMAGGMSAMDKNAWHFVPGWPGHMSQMKSATSGKSTKDQDQKDEGNGGHLNVFYSGNPDEDKEEQEQVETVRMGHGMGH